MNIKNGQTVNIHYVGTLNDGTEFDNSRTRGTPLSFKLGGGQILPAFEKAVQQMTIGEKKTLSLKPTEAYGEVQDEAFQDIPKTSFGPQVELTVGNIVHGQTPDGNPLRAVIKEVKEEEVTLDFNHPLAGKEINFDIELLSVE
jgi:peptidylprolyl isomerase